MSLVLVGFSIQTNPSYRIWNRVRIVYSDVSSCQSHTLASSFLLILIINSAPAYKSLPAVVVLQTLTAQMLFLLPQQHHCCWQISQRRNRVQHASYVQPSCNHHISSAMMVQVQYCTACRLVTVKAVIPGRLEVVASGGRPWCLHFVGESGPDDSPAPGSRDSAKVWRVLPTAMSHLGYGRHPTRLILKCRF